MFIAFDESCGEQGCDSFNFRGFATEVEADIYLEAHLARLQSTSYRCQIERENARSIEESLGLSPSIEAIFDM